LAYIVRGFHKYDLHELWKTYHTLLFPMSESNERIARGLVKHLLWGRNAGPVFSVVKRSSSIKIS